MDLPDEKESGMYDLKFKKNEDVVESLMDNDIKNTNNVTRMQKAPIVQPKQIGPTIMIKKVK